MITKTRAVVLKYLKYHDSSIIVQTFTKDYGLTSFMVQGIRSSRSKKSIGYFQPFSPLEIVAYIHPNRDIQRLSECKYFLPIYDIQGDVRKSTMVLFLSEVLLKLLHHERGPQESLFDYLVDSIDRLNNLTKKVENFHLHFLLKLMPYVGLEVENGAKLIASMELEMIEEDHHLISFVSKIIDSEFEDDLEATGTLRSKALQLILNYYQHHTAQIGEIKSLKVLHAVFN